MFFFLSKVFFFLLSPLNWLLGIGILYAFVKQPKWRKRLMIIAAAIIVVFGNRYLHKAVVLWWQPEVQQKSYTDSFEAGILLTGTTFSNSKKESYFGANADRMIQATKLYHLGVIRNLMIVGGDGSINQTLRKEADFLQQECIAQGIPPAALVVDNKSRNTYENALAAKRLADSMHWKEPLVLVTSAMHMRRAQGCFEKAGIMVEPHPANFEVLENPIGFEALVIPSLGVLQSWQHTLKEIAGYVAYKVTGKLD